MRAMRPWSIPLALALVLFVVESKNAVPTSAGFGALALMVAVLIHAIAVWRAQRLEPAVA